MDIVVGFNQTFENCKHQHNSTVIAIQFHITTYERNSQQIIKSITIIVCCHFDYLLVKHTFELVFRNSYEIDFDLLSSYCKAQTSRNQYYFLCLILSTVIIMMHILSNCMGDQLKI